MRVKLFLHLVIFHLPGGIWVIVSGSIHLPTGGLTPSMVAIMVARTTTLTLSVGAIFYYQKLYNGITESIT